MNALDLSRIVTISFVLICTILSWSELNSLQKILYPLWILSICLIN